MYTEIVIASAIYYFCTVRVRNGSMSGQNYPSRLSHDVWPTMHQDCGRLETALWSTSDTREALMAMWKMFTVQMQSGHSKVKGFDFCLCCETASMIFMLSTGISYMVFGERLDTFDESRKDLQEFQNAAVELISLIGVLVNQPPLYKYFPTKTYRRFVAAMNCTRKYGK